MKLSERMVLYRAKERISQAELARRCGVTLQTINSVENETQSPSKVTVAKIELVIGGHEDAEN
jgi:DNA-binding XRE family transcriptional regulator